MLNEGNDQINFLVAVRCRCLHAEEKRVSKQRYQQRNDTHQHCILLNRTLSSSLVNINGTTIRRGRREKSQVSVILIDPNSGSDFSSLWRKTHTEVENSDFSSSSSSLSLLQEQHLEYQELQHILMRKDGVRIFTFDEVFSPNVNNKEIYITLVQRLVIAAKKGYNGTFFAYGQTGTGKSYTVFGEKNKGIVGLCSLVAADLFKSLNVLQEELQNKEEIATIKRMNYNKTPIVREEEEEQKEEKEESVIYLSFLELYNERLRDLLLDSNTNTTIMRSENGYKRNGSNPTVSSIPCIRRNDDLEIIEHPVYGVHIPQLTRIRVHCVDQLEKLLQIGNHQRTKAQTNSNEISSRSHAIVQFTVKQRIKTGYIGNEISTSFLYNIYTQEKKEFINDERISSSLMAKLSIVDLAGSERITGFHTHTTPKSSLYTTTTATTTTTTNNNNNNNNNRRYHISTMEQERENRRREGANINKSLLALGNCIKSLGYISREEKKHTHAYIPNKMSTVLPIHHLSLLSSLQNYTKRTVCVEAHVPYRDSKLTRLLKESLGGNTQTVMLATISPSCLAFEETLSTLKYAARARSITRHVCPNIVMDEREEEEEMHKYNNNNNDDNDNNKEQHKKNNKFQEGKEDNTRMKRNTSIVKSPISLNVYSNDSERDRQLLLLTLEAEIRSLQTQLHMTRVVTQKIGLTPSVHSSKSTRIDKIDNTHIYQERIIEKENDNSSKKDESRAVMTKRWRLYNDTRQALQALRQERAEMNRDKRKKNEIDNDFNIMNKELVRELIRKERENARLQERIQRLDTFLS